MECKNTTELMFENKNKTLHSRFLINGMWDEFIFVNLFAHKKHAGGKNDQTFRSICFQSFHRANLDESQSLINRSHIHTTLIIMNQNNSSASEAQSYAKQNLLIIWKKW